MTSANVYYLDFLEPVEIEYDPYDRSTWILPKVLHRERIHALCEHKYNWEKILSLPGTTVIKTWGYDEEEEEWECQQDTWNEDGEYLEPEPRPTLKEWIEKMKPMNKELREILSV